MLPGDLEDRLSFGDTDGDGSVELLLASPDVGVAWLFEQPPASAADERDAVSVLTASTGVLESHAIGDLDADGYDDLAIADPRDGDGAEGVVWLLYGPIPANVELPRDAQLVLHPEEGDAIQTGDGLWFVDADGDGGDDLVINGGWSLDILYGLH
jgi:hypothetical protein